MPRFRHETLFLCGTCQQTRGLSAAIGDCSMGGAPHHGCCLCGKLGAVPVANPLFPSTRPRRGPFPCPLGDQILVRTIERERQIRGVDIPGAEEGRAFEGVVVSCGPGRVTEFGVRIPPEVEVGDVIGFPTHAGHEPEKLRDLPPGDYLFVRQDEIYLNYGPEPAKPASEEGIQNEQGAALREKDQAGTGPASETT